MLHPSLAVKIYILHLVKTKTRFPIQLQAALSYYLKSEHLHLFVLENDPFTPYILTGIMFLSVLIRVQILLEWVLILLDKVACLIFLVITSCINFIFALCLLRSWKLIQQRMPVCVVYLRESKVDEGCSLCLTLFILANMKRLHFNRPIISRKMSDSSLQPAVVI
jgi:hypothetical protein